MAKHSQIKETVSWHLVGHLQRNKVKKALETFDLIHSVNSLKLAQEISRCAQQRERRMDILVQVNASARKANAAFARARRSPFWSR